VFRRLLILLLLAAGIGIAAYIYFINTNQQSHGPLTGLPVSGDIANRRPVAVMIDNISPDARPQSGLDQASLVFETLAEGGITRFMAVYLEHDAPMIGPVRSTRYYYNSWAAGLGVIFGHDGGNVDALQELPTLSSIYNVDADRVTGPFWRISSRLAPHNEYTSSPLLRAYASTHGGSTTGIGYSLPHKDDAPLPDRPAVETIDVPFSYGDYNVQWTFDRSTDTYLRFMGGAPHVEAATSKQLRANNVVVMYTDETSAPDPFTPGAIRLRTEGTGKAIVYRDGIGIQGTWSKDSVGAPLRWLDSSGNQIALDRGVTWVEVLPA
jgi:hypothetical protein